MTAVGAVADDYLAALAHLDPQAAEAAGGTPESQLADLSPEAFEARAALARRTAAALTTATAQDPAQRALAGALAERLDSEIALHEAGFTTRLLAPWPPRSTWPGRSSTTCPGTPPPTGPTSPPTCTGSPPPWTSTPPPCATAPSAATWPPDGRCGWSPSSVPTGPPRTSTVA